MAAHYRLKYGIDEIDLSKSLPALKLRNNRSDSSVNSALSTSSGLTTIPSVQEIGSDSDSDNISPVIPKHSSHIGLREPQLNSSATVDIQWQTPTGGNKHNPKFRHSSYIPRSRDKDNHVKEMHPSNRYVNVSGGHGSASSSKLQPPHYVNNSVAVSEGITVYGSCPRMNYHHYDCTPDDIGGNIMKSLHVHIIHT